MLDRLRDVSEQLVGRPGDSLAGLDRGTAPVTPVVAGTGHRHREMEFHPDTGRSFAGVTVPDWDRLTDLCLTAASTMPDIQTRAWDIAPCEQRPVPIAVNIGGDFNLPQIAGDRGLLDEQFGAFLHRCEYR